MSNKNKILILALVLFLLPGFIFAATNLDEQIADKKSEVSDLQKRIQSYQKQIQSKQKEAASLANQLSIIENQIAKADLDIRATEAEIKASQLETRYTELEIITKEDAIENQRNNLSSVLQEIYTDDQKNALHIFLLNNSLSEFYNQIEYTKELQNSLQDNLGSLKTEKKGLNEKKNELEAKQDEFRKLKEELELKKTEHTGKQAFKDDLLYQTQRSEAKFTELYYAAKRDQQAVSAEITRLENEARNKLQEKPRKLELGQMNWPVPQRRITVTFHDPSYPFRYLFEHPAIDIASPQGTPIKAPADGYVLKARDAGRGYSYISLIHAKGISTVYGHVSKIYVKADEFVTAGEVIGLVGGMPGTAGAGRLTTGPHLHFEVRMNGIPVNPLNYLP
jgi:murein DD-endopeptidase MepM/ murein hydrolase activator NlpD